VAFEARSLSPKHIYETADRKGSAREEREREWSHRIHPRCPVVFRISDIHESGVGLSNDSTRGPFGGPSIEMVATLGSTTDLDAIPCFSSVILDDSHEMKIVLCHVGAEKRTVSE
jgi:hypothetical protein